MNHIVHLPTHCAVTFVHPPTPHLVHLPTKKGCKPFRSSLSGSATRARAFLTFKALNDSSGSFLGSYRTSPEGEPTVEAWMAVQRATVPKRAQERTRALKSAQERSRTLKNAQERSRTLREPEPARSAKLRELMRSSRRQDVYCDLTRKRAGSQYCLTRPDGLDGSCSARPKDAAASPMTERWVLHG